MTGFYKEYKTGLKLVKSGSIPSKYRISCRTWRLEVSQKKKFFKKFGNFLQKHIRGKSSLKKNGGLPTLLKKNSARNLSPQIRSSATLRVESSIIRTYSNITD